MSNNNLYQIGRFSTITRITVKALRLYHERGILEPTSTDRETGYRYYNEALLEKAFAIRELKNLGFSLKDISAIMESYNDDAELVDFLTMKISEFSETILRHQNMKRQLKTILSLQESTPMKNNFGFIEHKNVSEELIASVRFTGKYNEIGKAFKIIFKAVGFQISGKPGALYYDGEYKEENADIEAFVPVKKEIKQDRIQNTTLPSGKAYCITHAGPYETLSRSYKKILDYIQENNIEVLNPSREIYLKGPGMIFKGNPAKYRTEIQFFEAN